MSANMCKFRLEIALLLWIVQASRAQGEEPSCYGPGSIASAVIVTIVVTILLLFVLYVIWKRYWIKRKEKNLVLETDAEKGKNEYAYDNAAFGDVTSTPVEKVTEKNGKVDSTKSKWSQWSPLGVLIAKNEKQKTLDDSALQADEIKIVSLKSYDFTGLGFNIYGNMRDGIFIKDILHRGPASESGKLNSGDRIKSVTINFEHVVYEDALTILSYASPYEVILEAQGGKASNINPMPNKTAQLGHPLYRSSSTTDLIQIRKTTKKRLFPAEDVSTLSSPYSSLQKTRSSNVPTLERDRSRSPKPEYQNVSKTPRTQSPQHLKSQLEQKISQNHKQQLKTKNEKPRQESESALQKTENKYQKFGIKVLPVESRTSQPREQTSPKSAELSQNDNNINLERHLDKLKVTPTADTEMALEETSNTDEVDKSERKATAPPIKKREKSTEGSSNATQTSILEDETAKTETFVRNNSGTNGSGIKRDKDGIPQEIPSHMLNAAVAARRNRKASVENTIADDIKSPKKQKGRAPAPPDDKIKTNNAPSDQIRQSSDPKVENLEEISNNVEEGRQKSETASSCDKKDTSNYASDSDVETDNHSSVNTIELNASDITIHQSEDTEEIQNRRTASTGDLTKIQKTRKTSTGTLERAQSLDITDTAMPPLNKKRKGASIEENLDSKSGSDESLYGKALVHKEPRLSLALDGLNTFQRSRLKKSTEWGNLEDAIVNLDKDRSDAQFETVVGKIDQIKQESDIVHKKDDVQNTSTHSPLINKEYEQSSVEFCSRQYQLGDQNNTINSDGENKKFKNSFENQNGDQDNKLTAISFVTLGTNTALKLKNHNNDTDTVLVVSEACDDTESSHTVEIPDVGSSYANTTTQEISYIPITQTIRLFPNSITASESLLDSERQACGTDPYYNLSNKMYDTNVSDDIKVSRHSLGSLETSENFKHLNTSNGNVSNITIGEKTLEDSRNGLSKFHAENDELYTTALDATAIIESLKNDTNNESSFAFDKTPMNSPNLSKNVTVAEAFHDVNNTVTIEGPTSLTLEINDNRLKSPDEAKDLQISNKSFQISPTPATHPEHSPKSNFSLTYITEIQVLTPNTDVVESAPPTASVDKNRKNFESNIKQFESHIQTANNLKNPPTNEQIDPQKELHKIQEIAEEQLKKLPEMRFSTSSYETTKLSENSSLQIDQLRSNFEKSPIKTPPKADSTVKSRIPVATSKTPPTSPERRDSRNFDLEVDKEIVAIMSSPVHSTPIPSSLKYQPKIASKNVSITSIRSSSKIPSGFPNRPPVPPRRYESSDGESTHRLSTNGSIDSSFKQWVFNPNDNSITNLSITENKPEHK